jgi:aspartate ammonia-lyase
MRTEKDFLGELQLPAEALYGIHSSRASANFPNQEPFHIEWYQSAGKVKLACYQTVIQFRKALEKEHPHIPDELRIPSEAILNALIDAATEISAGEHYLHFIVPAIQGGAGTSINMNINEIITNRVLQLLGEKPGNYDIIDPIETANIYQSTNDVIPTALKVAVMELLNRLETRVNGTRKLTETLEKQHRNTLRISFTQLQEAVPGTYGQLFSSYSEALSRDWWRISKAFERIKQVNLGGGATGTGISFPRFYIMEVVSQLRKVTGLPLAQGENLTDITVNQDSLVEVHAILKAHAVNLEKMVSDLRLLSSGLSGQKELRIPERQAGSSIMPGKVNPVIPEYVISAAHQVYSNDQLITTLAAQGNFELNPYLPSIGHAMIGSLKLLISMNTAISDHLLAGLEIDATAAASRLFHSPAVTTALSPLIGYHRAAALSAYMKKQEVDIFAANDALDIVPREKLKKVMTAEYLLKKGFQVKDIVEFNKGSQ